MSSTASTEVSVALASMSTTALTEVSIGMAMAATRQKAPISKMSFISSERFYDGPADTIG